MYTELMNEVCLSAQIKAQTFCQIFESLTKNMKQNQKVYFLFNPNQMKIGLRQNSKTTQMQLSFNYQIFNQYSCRTNRNRQYILRKFQLSKFLNFQTFFETCKGSLKLEITQTMLTFTEKNQKKVSAFPVKALSIEADEEEMLKKYGFIRFRQDRQQSDYCHLQFNKAKHMQEIIRSGNTMKIDKIFISYQPNEKKLKFDLLKNGKAFLKLKVGRQIDTRGSPVTGVVFPFRKLKLAVGLLDTEKPFQMRLDNQLLVIEYSERDKKQFNITVCAQISEYEDFA